MTKKAIKEAEKEEEQQVMDQNITQREKEIKEAKKIIEVVGKEEGQQEMDQNVTERENIKEGKKIVEGVVKEEKQQGMDRSIIEGGGEAKGDMGEVGKGDGVENVKSGDHPTEPQTLPPAYTSHGSPVTHRRGGPEKPYSAEGDFIHFGCPPEPYKGSGTQSRGHLSQGKGTAGGLSSVIRNGASRLGYPVTPPPPVMIAVMGKTGTGKTSFVNAITGKGLNVGHGLEACTQDIQTASTTINDREVYLIDTPGFDDTHRSDVDILSTIADWVQQANRERKHLSGIIYLHRIVDPRMEGSSMKNLRMFRELCGEKNFNNVILCTTMWEKVDEEEGQRREDQLKGKESFWGNLVSRGAQVVRHRGPDLTASARKIAETLIQKDTIVLQLQEELNRNGSLSNTSAGRALTSEIEEIKKDHQKELETLRAEMKANSDKEELELLKEYYKKEIEGLRKATEDLEKLRADDARRFHQRLQEMQHQWDNRSKCIVC